MNVKEFIAQSREIHGNKYDYSLIEFLSIQDKIKIICPKHGIFEQRVKNHLNGSGCRKCANARNANIRKLTTEQFVEKARKVHGNKYDYSLVDYKKRDSKVKIICPKHGVFEQKADYHLSGNGCKECWNERRSKAITLTTKEFIAKAKNVHGDKYDYSMVDYKSTYNNVKIICKKHGVFEQTPNNHLIGHGCPSCISRPKISKAEQEIANWVESLGFDVVQSYRGWCDNNPNLEIDIFVPERNIGIEYNGVYWHGEQHMRNRGLSFSEIRYLHSKKSLLADEAGIHLIHIFSDLWESKKEILKSIIRLALGKPKRIIHARKCTVKEIDNRDAIRFFEKNHLYRKRNSRLNYALIYENDIVAVMSFDKSLFNESFEWELTRYAPILNTSIVGGPERLWKRFIEDRNPKNVICYADASLFRGRLYERLGFKNEGITEPCNWYLINGERVHRSHFTKKKLRQMSMLLDENMSSHQNVIKNGIDCIWDCGSYRLCYSL